MTRGRTPDPEEAHAAGPLWSATRAVDADPAAPLVPRMTTPAERAFLGRLRRAPATLRLAFALFVTHVLLSLGALTSFLPGGRTPLDEAVFSLVLLVLFAVYVGPAALLFRRLVHRRLKPACGRPPLWQRPPDAGVPLQQVTGAYSEAQGSYDRTYTLLHGDVASSDPYRVFDGTEIAMPPHWRRYVLGGVYAAALGQTLGQAHARRGLRRLLFGGGRQFYAVALTQAFTLAHLSRQAGVGLPGQILHSAADSRRLVLSVDREAAWGLGDILWYRPLRLASVLIAGGGGVLTAALLVAGAGAAVLGGPSSVAGFGLAHAVLTSPAGLAVLGAGAVLALPGAVSWYLHHRATRRIETGYAAAGLVPWPDALRRQWAEAPLVGASKRP